MRHLDSLRDEFESAQAAVGESIRLARGVVRWSVAILNVAGSYALIVWHEPRHLCGLAALTLVTVVFFDGAVKLVLRLHEVVWRVVASLTELGAVLGGIALLIRGAWTNDLVFPKLAALVFFGLLAVSGVIEGILWFLTHEPETPDPVEDHFPRRFDATVPTDDDAKEEARRLIDEEFRASEERP
jgi:hypothetical protein